MIEESTRVTSHSSTLIGHFYTNSPDKIVISVTKLTISDHYLIYGIRKFRTLKGTSNIIEFRDFKHFNEEHFLDDVRNQNLLNLYSYDDPYRMWHFGKIVSCKLSRKDKHNF